MANTLVIYPPILPALENGNEGTISPTSSIPTSTPPNVVNELELSSPQSEHLIQTPESIAHSTASPLAEIQLKDLRTESSPVQPLDLPMKRKLEQADAPGSPRSPRAKRVMQENSIMPQPFPSVFATPTQASKRLETLDVSPVKTPRTTTISLSHKKLSSPFRSPLMKASSTPSVPSQASLSSQQTTLPGTFPISKTANTTTPAKPKQVIRLRPPPATPSKSASPLKKPFRSPLSKSMSSSSTLTVSTPSVRVLEAQLRVLKQACKIKADKSEEKLIAVTKQWRSAGREAAEEVWNLVKDTGGTGSLNFASPSNSPAPFASSRPLARGGRDDGNWGGGFENGWGWEDKSNDLEGDRDTSSTSLSTSDRGAVEAGEAEDTYAEVPPDEDDEDKKGDNVKPEWTLGSMLSMLGIPKETLGWNDEEGEFVDA